MLARFPKLDAPLSMLITPPAPKGFEDNDDGPHAMEAPEIKRKFYLVFLFTVPDIKLFLNQNH